MAMRSPLVAVEQKSRHEYYSTKHEDLPIAKSDIEDFTTDFLTSLYAWPEFKSDMLAYAINPYVDPELAQKIISAQEQRFKDLKAKKLEQSLTFIRIEVLSDRVACHFDRLLKIDGLAIVIPTDLTLSMIRGDTTKANPLGVYIVGITEHEGAK